MRFLKILRKKRNNYLNQAHILISMFTNKIKSRDELKQILGELRKSNKDIKIVTTNGSFDLLHSGHVKSLLEAKKHGDILIVGLNSDSSIKQYKSKERPIIPQQERANMLAALECVDFVTIFDETVPNNFLLAIKPNIHIKSKTGYTGAEKEALAKIGAKLVLIDDIPGLSTSEIINKICKLYNNK